MLGVRHGFGVELFRLVFRLSKRLHGYARCMTQWGKLINKDSFHPVIWTHMATLQLLVSQYWWMGMPTDVHCFDLSCFQCTMLHGYIFAIIDDTLFNLTSPKTFNMPEQCSGDLIHIHFYILCLHEQSQYDVGSVKLQSSNVKDSAFGDFPNIYMSYKRPLAVPMPFSSHFQHHLKWNDKANKAFRAVNAPFTTATILSYPNSLSTYYSYTGCIWIEVGLGAVLL